MTPPKLNPQPIDDVARSGIPVIIYYPGQNCPPDGPVFWDGNLWRWCCSGMVCLVGDKEKLEYISLAVPIPGLPPKDGEWYFCWDRINGACVAGWNMKEGKIIERNCGHVPPDDIIAHLPKITLPKKEPKPTPGQAIDLSKATDKELLAELLRRNQ